MRTVHRDGHVEVDKSFYSVPPEYLRHRVLVRWDSRLVHIYKVRVTGEFNKISMHTKVDAGCFSTDPKHISSQKISNVERGATWLFRKISKIGPQATLWTKAMLENRGVMGIRVMNGLLSLTGKHSTSNIDNACGIALTHGAYRLKFVREIIKRKKNEPQNQFEFMEHHTIIRDINEYGRYADINFTVDGARISSHSSCPPDLV